MKLTSLSKTVVISVGLTAAIAGYVIQSGSTVCLPDEQQQITTSPTCQSSDRKNWLSWIKGDSRSAQFHFVDFLELLNRMKN